MASTVALCISTGALVFSGITSITAVRSRRIARDAINNQIAMESRTLFREALETVVRATSLGSEMLGAAKVKSESQILQRRDAFNDKADNARVAIATASTAVRSKALGESLEQLRSCFDEYATRVFSGYNFVSNGGPDKWPNAIESFKHAQALSSNQLQDRIDDLMREIKRSKEANFRIHVR